VLGISFLRRRLRKGGIGLTHRLGYFLPGRVQRELRHHAALLAKGIRIDHDDSLRRLLSFDHLTPKRSILFQIKVETADHGLGPSCCRKVLRGLFALACLEHQHALIT
jgi:hypothetical protein